MYSRSMWYLWEVSNGKFSGEWKCGKWIHGRCTKVKRVTSRLGRDFLCGRCKKQADRMAQAQGMWRVAELKKVLAEGERNGLLELCKSGDVIWE